MKNECVEHGFENGFSLHEVPWNIFKKQKINQIFKLLPIREEGGNWKLYLEELIVEIGGLSQLEEDEDKIIAMNVITRLQSLKMLDGDDDESFILYRKIIFEILSVFKGWV